MQIIDFKLAVSTREGQYIIRPEEIVRLESRDHTTLIFLDNHKQMQLNYTLSAFAEILGPLGFVRTHRAHVVNSSKVTFLSSKGMLSLKDSSFAVITKKARPVLLELLRHKE